MLELAQNEPTGHAIMTDAPAGQKNPGAHAAATAVRPVVLQYEPAGHAMQVSDGE